jgi:hypothetical protein
MLNKDRLVSRKVSQIYSIDRKLDRIGDKFS